jgi:tRNA (adenine57-N1/adenine58-N1)-methyltransferase
MLLLNALRMNRFAFLDVCEILLRFYKSEADRFRPVDRMVAHTGYLVFGRPVVISGDERATELLAEMESEEPEL